MDKIVPTDLGLPTIQRGQVLVRAGNSVQFFAGSHAGVSSATRIWKDSSARSARKAGECARVHKKLEQSAKRTAALYTDYSPPEKLMQNLRKQIQE